MNNTMPTLAHDDAAPAERKRRQILDATLRVVAAGGVDAVKHRRVAQEAGVPLGSITYYFASREDLIRSAFEHFLAVNTSFLDSLRGEVTGRTAEDVVEFLALMVQREFEDPAFVLAEYELILYAARDEMLAESFRRWERGVTAELAAVLESLGAPRPFAAARTLVELLRGFEVLRLVGAHRADELRPRLRAVLGALLAPTRGESK